MPEARARDSFIGNALPQYKFRQPPSANFRFAQGWRKNSKLFDILKRNSEFLEQQLDDYNLISGNFETKFAFETKPTTLAFGKAEIVVPKSSAVVPGQRDAEQIAIMDDHINIVKFAKQSSDFTKVARHLKLMVEKASIKMQEN